MEENISLVIGITIIPYQVTGLRSKRDIFFVAIGTDGNRGVIAILISIRKSRCLLGLCFVEVNISWPHL